MSVVGDDVILVVTMVVAVEVVAGKVVVVIIAVVGVKVNSGPEIVLLVMYKSHNRAYGVTCL